MNRVEDSLDVVKLVRSNRALTTLLRLLLTKDERRLLRLQRRQSVLEYATKHKPAESSDIDNDSDQVIMRWAKADHNHVSDS